jgi:hypothetical protein
MPLTREEKNLIKKIRKEYEKKGYSKERAETIANAVVYSHKRQIEGM